MAVIHNGFPWHGINLVWTVIGEPWLYISKNNAQTCIIGGFKKNASAMSSLRWGETGTVVAGSVFLFGT